MPFLVKCVSPTLATSSVLHRQVQSHRSIAAPACSIVLSVLCYACMFVCLARRAACGWARARLCLLGCALSLILPLFVSINFLRDRPVPPLRSSSVFDIHDTTQRAARANIITMVVVVVSPRPPIGAHRTPTTIVHTPSLTNAFRSGPSLAWFARVSRSWCGRVGLCWAGLD